ncbi:hypothetical protein CK203_055222 [Vitis vinifera]|uniref:Uncharacterized protein n=1 Tax=Vitis vinifera TaxID=29760 RepID=A0A438GU00_VITVI|nr:hypothetical protein CK203_055222 [Vitis vinifera]
MDPQAFIRLSIGSLGLRIPGPALNAAKSGIHAVPSPCSCEIRLRGFPVQTSSVPLVSSPEATPDSHSIAAEGFPLWCWHQKAADWTFKLEESGKPGAELHLRVKLDPDPRYVFQFEDVATSSPQIVQLQGTIKQPIFSCKFSRDRIHEKGKRPLSPTTLAPVGICFQISKFLTPSSSPPSARVFPGRPIEHYWSGSADSSEQETERRERKGWKVKIHDLSGSAVAAAFITTPFVPSTGCDWVARSNPGAWLIVRPDACRPESWQPWGKLEAWRERGIRDSICLPFSPSL